MSIPDEVFSGKPHKMTMGLRPLDMSTWLDPEPDHPQRRVRTELLSSRRAQVYQCHPGHEVDEAVVAEAVAQWVGRQLPGRDAPLVEAAHLVRDDLCVLARVDGVWTLVAAVVCFPSRWRLSDKIGRDIVAIHDPVPDYRRQLGAPTHKVMDTLSPRRRINWTLLPDNALFQPSPAQAHAGPPVESWFLRVERQCLVPIGDVAAFTIRTDVMALDDLPDSDRAAILHSARTAPDEMAVYRGWVSR